MLKANYSTNDQTLTAVFELPITPRCQALPGLSAMLASLERAQGCAMLRQGDDLAGFSLPLDSLESWLADQLNESERAIARATLAEVRAQASEFDAGGLEIDFHQNPFDTPERYWSFVDGQGNLPQYLLNRVLWHLAPKNRIVTPFPLHVDIESSSWCNMDCPMCYRRGLAETGHMDEAVFKKAIDECAENGVYSVRLSWRGETLTQPRIKEFIAYACERIPNVSFLTNAFFIKPDMAECFVECGVSYVAVSFDGIGEVYEKVRAPAKFEKNRARLAMLRQVRQDAGATRPQVRLCTIWPAISMDPQAYTEAMAPVSDYLVCNPYINFMGPMTIKPDFICQYPWERLVVGFNGETQCCTGWNAKDVILGNVKETSLKEMWLGDRLNEIRAIHASGRRLEIGGCAECRHGSKGDETVTIDDILERKW